MNNYMIAATIYVGIEATNEAEAINVAKDLIDWNDNIKKPITYIETKDHRIFSTVESKPHTPEIANGFYQLFQWWEFSAVDCTPLERDRILAALKWIDEGGRITDKRLQGLTLVANEWRSGLPIDGYSEDEVADINAACDWVDGYIRQRAAKEQ